MRAKFLLVLRREHPFEDIGERRSQGDKRVAFNPERDAAPEALRPRNQNLERRSLARGYSNFAKNGVFLRAGQTVKERQMRADAVLRRRKMPPAEVLKKRVGRLIDLQGQDDRRAQL